MRTKGLLLVVLVGMLVACGLRAQAADYETCFAFDPVFVQADQRRAPPVTSTQTKAPSETAKQADLPREPKKLKKLSLTALSRALEALEQETKKTDATSKGR
jgi:hypothetical protein